MVSEKRFDFIDYIKVIACFSVIAVHVRLNLMSAIPASAFGMKSKLFFAFDYQLFISCVPLFLMCTGFLMINKKYDGKYILSLIKTYGIYVVCSIMTAILFFSVIGTPIILKEVVYKIFTFKEISYSWYVEMYLGLGMLIPMLNKIIKDCTKKQLKTGVAVLVMVIAIPKFVNSVGPINRYIILPAYWTGFYPIIYYLLGAYFRLYQLEVERVKKQFVLLGYLGMVALGIMINIFNSSPYVGDSEGGYASILIVAQSALLFLLIMQNMPRGNSVIRMISKITLPIYLMSNFVDLVLYPKYIQYFGGAKGVIKMFIVIVIAHFLLSFILAFIADKINQLVFNIIFKRYKKHENPTVITTP